MKQYEVLISDKASEDMEAIYNYIADKLLVPATAAKQYDRIADAILSLETMPERIKVQIASTFFPNSERRISRASEGSFFRWSEGTFFRVLEGSFFSVPEGRIFFWYAPEAHW